MLPSANCGFALAHSLQRSGTGSSRRLARAIEKFFQDDSVVRGQVARSEQQSQALALVSKLVELAQGFFAIGLRKFLQISLAKDLPLSGTSVIPAPKFVARGNVAQPFVEFCVRLRKAAGPQAIDEN